MKNQAKPSWTEVRAIMLETFAELRDEDLQTEPDDRDSLMQELRRKTGQPPEEIDRILTRIQFGTSSDGIHVHTPASGAAGVESTALLIGDRDWRIRYFVVDTRNWFPGKKVLVSIDWLESVSFPVRSAYVNLKRDQIRNFPEYAPDEPISRDYEEDLHHHYRLPGYRA